MSQLEEGPNWEITLGFYEGILLGIRTYSMPNVTIHSLYIPFVNLCLTIDKTEK